MKIESVLFSDDLRKLIRYPENRNGDTYSVPDGIEEIADSAFSHHHLKKIVIPDSIETIGAHAFATKNEKIFLPKSELSKCAVELPSKPIRIDYLAFSPFKYRNRDSAKMQDHIVVLQFRYKNATIPVELMGNWKLNAEELKLAEFIETGDIGRKKSLFADTNTSCYKTFMAFYLALIHGDEESTKYLLKKRIKISENQDYAPLLEYLDTEHTPQTEKKISRNFDFSKWSIRDLPDGTYEIEKYKGQEKSVEIPDEYNGIVITSIGECAFSAQSIKACAEIERIIVPDCIKVIKEKAFEYCKKLKEVELPDSLTEIGKEAFQFCDSLTGISLPENVTIINEGAFKWCKSLHSIKMGASVTYIKKGALSGCNSLETIELPEGLVSIGSSSFHGCGKLRCILLPRSLKEIGMSAFGYCKSLETIHIPDKAHLGVDVATPFNNCKSLKEITASENNVEYSSVDGVLFDKAQKTIVCYPMAFGTDYAIPEGVEVIGKNAFKDCEKLGSVIIPNSVCRIEDGAFNGCSELKKIEISENVVFIGNAALPESNCTIYAPYGSWAEKYCLKNSIPVIISSEESEFAKEEPQICFGSLALNGKTFSSAGFTEKEESEIAKSVENNGGKYLFNFATELNYLIYNNDSENEPIKMKKAKLLVKKGADISFITIEEYHKMIK